MMRFAFALILIGLAAGAALFPLSLALGQVDLARMGLVARDADGTIWQGTIGDLNLRGHSLGAFDVSLTPQSMLGGTIDMTFVQAGEGEQPLTGSLRADGPRRGIVATSGRLAPGDLFGALPIETLILSDVTMMFDDGRCAEASGTVATDIAIGVGGFGNKRTLDGALSCQGERVRLAMRSVTGIESAELMIAADGTYTAVIGIDAVRSGLGGALALLGFRRRGSVMELAFAGQL